MRKNQIQSSLNKSEKPKKLNFNKKFQKKNESKWNGAIYYNVTKVNIQSYKMDLLINIAYNTKES